MQIEAAEAFAYITEILTFKLLKNDLNSEPTEVTEFIHEVHSNHSVIAVSADLIKKNGTVETIECKLQKSRTAQRMFKKAVDKGESALLVQFDGKKRSVSDRLRIELGNCDKSIVQIEVQYSFIAQMEIIDQLKIWNLIY